MMFEHPSSEACLDAMEREMESVMHDTGVSLLWRTLDSATSQESFANLAVRTSPTGRSSCFPRSTATMSAP